MKSPAGEDRREGWQAWVVLAAAFASMLTVFCVAYSFGAFFRPMQAEFGAGSGATSAVFAITAFIYFGLGAVSGAVADRVGPRPVVLLGACAMGSGLLLTAAAPSIWWGYVTYGVGVGLGTACGYVPMVAAVGGWFDRRRGFAIGLAVAGIGLGTLVAGPMAAALIAHSGWRRAYVYLGVAAFAILVLCGLAASRPPVATGSGPGLGTAVRTREFARLYGAGLLVAFGLFTAFVHLVPYAERIGYPAVQSAALISVIGVGSILSRLALGVVADRAGAVRSFQLSLLIVAVSFPIWLVAGGYAGLVVFAFVLGAGYGGWVALSPSVMAELFGPAGLGGNVGVLYTSAGLGALIGPPLAGLLVDSTGSYRIAIAVAIVFSAAGAVLVAPLRRPRHVPSET